MGQTSPDALPWPEQTDPVNVSVDMNELATAVQVALTSVRVRLSAIEDVVGQSIPKVLRWSQGAARDIPAGTNWQDLPGYSWSWTVPDRGVMLFVASAELLDDGSKNGDPRVRLALSGSAIINKGSGSGTIGIKAGNQTLAANVVLEGTARVEPGTLNIKIQGSTTTGNQIGRIRNGAVSAVWVPVVRLSGDNMDDSAFNTDGSDGG